MICSPLLAKQYFMRHRWPAFTDWDWKSVQSLLPSPRGACFKGASFTRRIHLYGKGPRNYNVQLRLVRVAGGGRINSPPPPPPTKKKVQQSFLNQSLDPPIKNSWIRPWITKCLVSYQVPHYVEGGCWDLVETEVYFNAWSQSTVSWDMVGARNWGHIATEKPETKWENPKPQGLPNPKNR